MARVCGHLSTFVDRPSPNEEALLPVNDSAHIAMEFENGAQGAIQVSAMAHLGNRGLEQRVVLHGASGTLEADYFFGIGWEVRGLRDGEEEFQTLTVPDRFWEHVDHSEPLQSQLLQLRTKEAVLDRHFVEAILEDKPVSPTFVDGYGAQLVVDAAMESQRKSRWVDVT